MQGHKEIYDLIGVGIGPFNLGLAALSEPIHGFKTLFFDKTPGFNWHPGLMLEGATLQVPFMADLVTMADPTSAYSFLNFMKETGRIYKFYIRENFFLFRKEYNAYCQWVAKQLQSCLFGQEVVDIIPESGLYRVQVKDLGSGTEKNYWAKKLVLGTGTSPYVPPQARDCLGDHVIHTSEFLNRQGEIVSKKSIAVIGSGQSAAEVFRELLPLAEKGTALKWFTRSNRFFPLENHAKLTLEMTSPEYVDYFYGLSDKRRAALLKEQKVLYKGINYDLINELYNSLYEKEWADGEVDVTLMPNCKLMKMERRADSKYTLDFLQTEQERLFEMEAEAVVLATGYHYQEPPFLKSIEDHINRKSDGALDVSRNYTIDLNREVYVQNAELHTHGFVSPDLGMGAYRNAYILRELLGREVYKVEKQIAFQQFGVQNKPVEASI